MVWASGRPEAEGLFFWLQAATALHYGKLAKAREFIELSVKADQREGLNASAATTQALAGLWEAEYGDLQSARKSTSAALATSPGRNAKIAAALAWAELKDVSRAQTMAAELNHRFPDATLLSAVWLPTIRAKVALTHSDPDGAIKLLEATLPYDLSATPPLPFFYSSYVRGYAYLPAPSTQCCRAKVPRVLDHKGISGASPTATLSLLGLARAEAMGGNTAPARTAYQDFFALWKDADPDIPISSKPRRSTRSCNSSII